MELKEFIKEALLQIGDGITDAIESSKDSGLCINPATDMKAGEQTIKFSIMVETSSKGGINIKIAEGGCSTNNVNRIDFEVKAILPCTEDTRYKKDKPVRTPS